MSASFGRPLNTRADATVPTTTIFFTLLLLGRRRTALIVAALGRQAGDQKVVAIIACRDASLMIVITYHQALAGTAQAHRVRASFVLAGPKTLVLLCC